MPRDCSTEELRARLRSVTVVEAVGAAFYRNAHLPGAVNLPPHHVRQLAATLLPDKSAAIVVYAAHARSPDADIVIRQLTALGYHNLSRYPGGKESWVQAGLPLTTDET
jgi:rhodanese-related sulfurtransferase